MLLDRRTGSEYDETGDNPTGTVGQQTCAPYWPGQWADRGCEDGRLRMDVMQVRPDAATRNPSIRQGSDALWERVGEANRESLKRLLGLSKTTRHKEWE
jgi:hypothetical protein